VNPREANFAPGIVLLLIIFLNNFRLPSAVMKFMSV